MVVDKTQSASNIRGRDSRAVTERQNPIDGLPAAAHRLQHGVRRPVRRLETHRDRSIIPRIIKLMATVGDGHNVDTQFARSLIKTTGLVPQLPRKKQNSPPRQLLSFSHPNGPTALIAPITLFSALLCELCAPTFVPSVLSPLSLP